MGLWQLLVCAAAAAAASQEWAVVTGASSGIGAALAQRAADAGYGVVLHGRDKAALRRVGEGLGPDATYRVVVADLANPNGAKKLHGACRGLDVALLLANAGAARTGAFLDDDLDRVESLVALNVASTVDLCHRFGRDLRARGAGRVVITASLVGVPAHGCAGSARRPGRDDLREGNDDTCLVGSAAYAATKAFLRSFGNALHDELAAAGVRVTVLLPGAVDTKFAGRAGMDDALVFKVPGARALGVVSKPDDVARAAFSRTGREVVPGLANRAYALATEALPNAAGRAVARLSFGPSPKFGRAGFVAPPPRPRGGPGAQPPPPPAIVAAAAPDAAWLALARPAAFGAAAVLGGLSLANVLQNGRLAPERRSSWTTKAEFVSTWKALAPPPETVDGEWDGELEFLGAAAPVNGFITNRLFTVGGGRWLGKAFGPDGDGANRFAGGVAGRPFRYGVEASRLDGKPALVLNYAAAGDRLWGTTLRMRDGLRELEPGVLLGLGSMAGTGGAKNCAPFVLRLADPESRVTDD